MNIYDLKINDEFYLNFYNESILFRVATLPFEYGKYMLINIKKISFNKQTKKLSTTIEAYTKTALKTGNMSKSIFYNPRRLFIKDIFKE